ncbi:hypothetical protein OK016_16095 [Vibrio chagasii]|nr:hypothetical protein [Vibrio chagasii]
MSKRLEETLYLVNKGSKALRINRNCSIRTHGHKYWQVMGAKDNADALTKRLNKPKSA